MERLQPAEPAPEPIRPTWLIRNDFERSRFRELHVQLVGKNQRLYGLLLLVFAASVPAHHGIVAPIVAALLGVALNGIVQRVALRLPRPEVWVLVALLGSVACIAIAVACYTSGVSPAMMMVIWPLSGIAGRYNRRVATAAVIYTSAVVVAAILSHDVSLLWRQPATVFVPVVALIAVAVNCTILRDGDVASRNAAVLDPLTGMLNRTALARRVEELEHLTRVTGDPVGVIVLDLDHFKEINDTHGHAVGDDVLRDVAYVLRRELRAYDQVYRLGGEEFVVLLPGCDAAHARGLAERLRQAIAAQPVAGIRVSASLGATSSPAEQPFSWEQAFARADAALYRAKASGRNRVAVDGEGASARRRGGARERRHALAR